MIIPQVKNGILNIDKPQGITSHDVVDVIRKILKEFEILYLQYINKDSKGETLDICRQYSAIIEKDVYLIKGEEKELVRCLDINQEGNLIVRTKNNIKREIISGEVSIRGIKGYV